MNTLMAERLNKAIEDKKNNDVNSFIWKGPKTERNGELKQTEKKLIEMSGSELDLCYNHCKNMLNNTDVKNPGRYVVLKIISDYKVKCNAELFIRYIEQNHNENRFSLMNSLSDFLSKNKEVFAYREALLSDAFNDLPKEYETIPVKLIIDGCTNKMGVLNNRYITKTFIYKYGIWLTHKDMDDLEIKLNSSAIEKLDKVKTTLGIKDSIILFVNPSGFNYEEFRAMVKLKRNNLYNEMTTKQLETLRNKVLFALEQKVTAHAESWERKITEIEMAAEAKGIQLYA